MDPKDRAELDRLLDLAEMEQLLAAAPSAGQEQAVADLRPAVVELEREHDAIRQRRDQLAPDAEWLDE